MPDLTKIATCCYCGSRTVLRLTARDRHELACASCGAALHNMKPLKAKPATAPKPSPSRPIHLPPKPRKSPKKRSRKRWMDVLEDVWDEIEDIFD
ncbi:hypothetical protein [Algicella marina]|uniref:Uncharacterized protein n=1 Tax=Algicella marina TaxID=2683284 RepID=A0A6P1SXC5_9RHOB|nr:hypothetical protein [Algicella marina]QHQ34131.1 hypothetical protein GO499_02480 [Algicella marina]